MASGIWRYLPLLVFISVPVLAEPMQPQPTSWATIAGSDIIVIGTIAGMIEDPERDSKYHIGKLDIEVHGVLKGRVPDRLQVEYFVESGLNDDLFPKMKALRGKSVLVFMLTTPDHEHPPGPRFSLSTWRTDSVVPDSSEAEEGVRHELAQEPIEASGAALYLSRLDGGTTESQVQAAIESMASGFEGRRDAGVVQLRTLGCKGIPYIIKHMDDRRPFQGVLKGPSDFEAYAQYSPKLMADALDMVLGFMVNPVRWPRSESLIDDAETRKIIDSWLLYVAHHRADAPNAPLEPEDMCTERW